ncbi:MAG: nitronate monooxygenase [Hahellaceae bacterium]|nr:nitronate monooxygenase [Hahellaceae bacterium]MCP5212114.1 nitronate monooxygenase [Hahellaceae bacterium]
MPLPSNFGQHLSLPVVVAPMFLISNPDLVVACCKKGIVGTFPSLNQRTTAEFEAWVIQINQSLEQFKAEGGKPAPFGVNLIVHKTNPRAMADLEICVKHKVPLVITSLGAAKEVVDAVHSYGGLVFHDVINRRHAEKAAEAGVDGIIAVCAGAGGHAGTINPFALVAEIRQFFDKTLLLSGCISSGSDVAAAITMGADLAYMGTRFINTQESPAIDPYKNMINNCGADDIIYTPAVSGVKASFMKPSLIEAGYDMEKLVNPASIDYGNKLTPDNDESKAWKTVWSAGQGVAAIHDIPSVSTLVDDMTTEFAKARSKQWK